MSDLYGSLDTSIAKHFHVPSITGRVSPVEFSGQKIIGIESLKGAMTANSKKAADHIGLSNVL